MDRAREIELMLAAEQKGSSIAVCAVELTI